MEAARRPLWEFGPNRVKAVGGDPRILIDSANTHTLSTQRGLALACMCKMLPQGPADIAHCWHAHHLAPGLGRTMVFRPHLAPAANELPWGDHRWKSRASRQDLQRAITARTPLGLLPCKQRYATFPHHQDNWSGNVAIKPAWDREQNHQRWLINSHGPFTQASVGPYYFSGVLRMLLSLQQGCGALMCVQQGRGVLNSPWEHLAAFLHWHQFPREGWPTRLPDILS